MSLTARLRQRRKRALRKKHRRRAAVELLARNAREARLAQRVEREIAAALDAKKRARASSKTRSFLGAYGMPVGALLNSGEFQIQDAQVASALVRKWTTAFPKMSSYLKKPWQKADGADYTAIERRVLRYAQQDVQQTLDLYKHPYGEKMQKKETTPAMAWSGSSAQS